ncbi:MAG: hypothetical protein NTX53_13565 [candidate division WOR-3 bacterium]|nr:hypothetical protein [candidate division WOR-3 bacterium]
MIAISLVLSTCVQAFAGLCPAKNAEGRTLGAVPCAYVHGQVGLTSRCPVKMCSAGPLPRGIFRTNASGSSEPWAAGGKRSAFSTRKVVLIG